MRTRRSMFATWSMMLMPRSPGTRSILLRSDLQRGASLADVKRGSLRLLLSVQKAPPAPMTTASQPKAGG